MWSFLLEYIITFDAIRKLCVYLSLVVSAKPIEEEIEIEKCNYWKSNKIT